MAFTGIHVAAGALVKGRPVTNETQLGMAALVTPNRTNCATNPQGNDLTA